MPNLYKQYFVQNQNENARVINPNAVLEARAAKILERQRAEQKHQEELSRSFEAGIVTETTDKIEETEPVCEAQLVKEEAERILNDAKCQAEAVLNQAYADAKNIHEEARVQGYADGNAAMQKELEEARMKLLEELSSKVFHIQFDNKKHILMHLIDDAILNIEGDRKFRIKVAESNVLFLENHREDILERVGHGIELEFIADSTMDGNECLIETDSGVFDCSLGTQLENLIKDIRSLCS